MQNATPPRAYALTIAGSDSGGGAGIQADLRAFASQGVFGLSAITAVTAQNSRAVDAVQVLSQRMVRAQIDAVQNTTSTVDGGGNKITVPDMPSLLGALAAGLAGLAAAVGRAARRNKK